MSFQDAEASDATLAGTSSLLRDALQQPSHVPNPHQVYENMDLDPLIGALPRTGEPASRVELLQRMSHHRHNPSAMHEAVVEFCRSHMKEGPDAQGLEARVFVRVQRLVSLANAMADPESGLSRRNAEALVRDLVANISDHSTHLARQQFHLSEKALSQYPMWCYPPSDSRTPFHEIGGAGGTRGEAINVLGLGCFAHDDPPAELVRWAHALPEDVRAHCPTAWDAGASPGNVYWRPGGRTWQLDRAAAGVPEVVHDPIRGADLIVPIEVLP